MPNCSTTADSSTVPRQKNPTVEKPPKARNAPPRAAPPTPPIWLLAPSIPTAVAWELPEISVLMARNIAAPVTARNRVCLTTGVVVICAN